MTIKNHVSILLSILSLTFTSLASADEWLASDVTEAPELASPVRACDPGPLTSYRMKDVSDSTADGFSASVSYTCMNEECVVNHLSAEANFFRTNMSFYGHRATNWLSLSDAAGAKAISSESIAKFSKNCFGQVEASVTCGKKSNMCIVSVIMTREF